MSEKESLEKTLMFCPNEKVQADIVYNWVIKGNAITNGRAYQTINYYRDNLGDFRAARIADLIGDHERATKHYKLHEKLTAGKYFLQGAALVGAMAIAGFLWFTQVADCDCKDTSKEDTIEMVNEE